MNQNWKAAHLGVLQERGAVVPASPSTVLQRISVCFPLSHKHYLLPCLVDANHRGVDDSTDDGIREILVPVVKTHPEGQ